jgi:outer membrane protein OmpA-like peptidoglycan-associated protein
MKSPVGAKSTTAARMVVAFAISMLAATGYGRPRKAPESGWPEVCYNRELLDAIQIIDSACKPYEDCDMAALTALDKSVDKDQLFIALSDLALTPQHVFFKTGKSDIGSVLHWQDWKVRHLKDLKKVDQTRAIVFVIGQASQPGDFDKNFTLSRLRAEAVVKYLQADLGLSSVRIKVGWLGESAMQLHFADAEHLRIDRSEFDSDVDKLNQAVHIFAFPCGEMLGK